MADEQIFELELTGMAHGGSAVGRHDGRAIFVPYAIPGEQVTARITQDKGRFANAEMVEVINASEARISPRCSHFGRCGGCHWQHMDYAAQLVFKQQVVADQLARIGGLRDVTVHPTIPSPDPWNYRSHVTFHATDEGRLGFVATDKERVISIEECHIIRPKLAEMFEGLKAREFKPRERIRLQVGTDETPSPPAPLPQGEEHSSSSVHYTVKGHTFAVSAGSFFQANLPQAAALVDLVLDRLQLHGMERVLDLYSGVGLFTAFLAERASYVTAVESYPPAVQDALATLAGFDNVEIMEGAVEEALGELRGRYDAAVTDPPRMGMERTALDVLVKAAPAKIVYVSCDPATLARDAKRLASDGYHLRDVQPVDMFPQTYHIEAVAAFEKRV